MTMPTRADCQELDRQDALAPLRDQFSIPPDLIYLDGNSLGVLPAAAAARVTQVVQQEWGQGLIRSWNSAGWFELPQRVGDKIARLIGAGAGEVVATDSTSVNLFKVLSAALHLQQEDAPSRRVVLSERAIAYDFHDYKTQGVDAARLTQWVEELGWEKVLNRAGVTFRNGRALGKAPDAAAARAMLASLAGREHQVMTGVVLVTASGEREALATATVRFRHLDDALIDRYVAQGEWQGRAGAYAIQGAGADLVESTEGDPTTIIGLPMQTVAALLRDENLLP